MEETFIVVCLVFSSCLLVQLTLVIFIVLFSTGQLTYSAYHNSLSRYEPAYAALAVRQLMPLLPVNLPKSNLDFTSVCRQTKSAVDNTLFVYPLLLDRFKNR